MASLLTLKDLLHCQGSILQTRADTPLQAEAEVPVILLQTHAHLFTYIMPKIDIFQVEQMAKISEPVCIVESLIGNPYMDRMFQGMIKVIYDYVMHYNN